MTITHVYQLCAKENSLYRNAHFSERPHIKPLNEPPPSYVQDHSFLLKAVLLDRQLSDPRGTAHGLKTLCATCHTHPLVGEAQETTKEFDREAFWRRFSECFSYW